ncbi:hypothetical protein [Nonomuraea basaltis]|uniref:hypothetical protein n=1 Tax=Nonomuraea basaltis TaxID=2495887 RepID=UPI00110C5E6F|nr:hypothetical protein [Nonomuraea basaltis]TMR96371.1 hypothetical protein EJK15_23555 [Nonomuraea basaltis]
MLLKNHLRRDLQWLKRQARKDRRITVALLVGVVAAWTRQLSPWDAPDGSEVLLGLSLGLLAGSGIAWLASAFLVTRTIRARKEPVEQLRWVSRIRRSKEWAFWSVSAYVAWHLLQFVTALVLG